MTAEAVYQNRGFAFKGEQKLLSRLIEDVRRVTDELGFEREQTPRNRP